MGKDIIQAEYDQLHMISARFTQQAEHIHQQRAQLRTRLRDLQDGGWIGRGSQAFFGEMHGLVLPAVSRLHDALSEASRVTLKIIDIMQEAEKEAASKFRGNPAGGSGGVDGATDGAAAAGLAERRSSQSMMVNDPKVFLNEAYMESLIGSRFRGDDLPELNRLLEDFYKLEKNNSHPDQAEARRLLDRIADIRGVDRATMHAQYATYLQLRANANAEPDIDLNKHGGFLGSTVSLRYGKVVGDTFGIDPIFGALLNPTGGLVGSANDSYRPSTNDAIGYHGTVHDAAGYLYNHHGQIGPGYDYMGRDILATNNPLAGQVGGIAWWISHAELEANGAHKLIPDIPYVPKFVEGVGGEIVEAGSVAIMRVGGSTFEGGRDIVNGIGDMFNGDFKAGGGNMLRGAETIGRGIGRSVVDIFD